MSGWPGGLFETCPMITLPASNFSRAAAGGTGTCAWAMKNGRNMKLAASRWLTRRRKPSEQQRFCQMEADEVARKADDERHRIEMKDGERDDDVRGEEHH